MRLSVLPLVVCVAFGCGTRTIGQPGNEGEASPPTPIALFVDGESSCAEAAPLARADAELALSSTGESLAVVELAFVDECTGLGGHWVLARTIDRSRTFFLGGHGCRSWTESPISGEEAATAFGVIRFAQTAAFFRAPEGACVSFPGDEGRALTSDAKVQAVALFDSRAAAERYAALRR